MNLQEGIMDKGLKIISAIILLSVFLPGLIAGCSTNPATPQAPVTSSLAPDFQLQDLDGRAVSLSGLRGKPVILNFWATWCGPCRDEMPFIQEIFENKEWSDKGLVILAVDIGESPSTVKEFLESYGLSFQVLLDSEQSVAKNYNIRGIPTTFFIDKDGIIQDMKIGAFTSKAEIEQRLINSIVSNK